MVHDVPTWPFGCGGQRHNCGWKGTYTWQSHHAWRCGTFLSCVSRVVHELNVQFPLSRTSETMLRNVFLGAEPRGASDSHVRGWAHGAFGSGEIVRWLLQVLQCRSLYCFATLTGRKAFRLSEFDVGPEESLLPLGRGEGGK